MSFHRGSHIFINTLREPTRQECVFAVVVGWPLLLTRVNMQWNTGEISLTAQTLV